MARSKAYLFGGVEIRWKCAPSLLEGVDSVPAEANFRFPNGLKDYLAPRHRGQGTRHRPGVLRQDHQARRPRLARMGGRLDGGRGRISSRIATRSRPPRAARTRTACASRFCAALREHAERVGPGQADGARHDGRRHGDLRLHALGLHPGAGIPGPDQGQARNRRGRPHRRDGHSRRLRPLARGLAPAGQQAARLGDRPGGRAPAPPPGKGSRAQDRDPQAAPARQARRLQQCRRGGLRTLHRRGRLGRRLRQAGARPRHPGRAPAPRQDPQRGRRPARTSCIRTSSCPISSRRSDAARARATATASCATRRS